MLTCKVANKACVYHDVWRRWNAHCSESTDCTEADCPHPGIAWQTCISGFPGSNVMGPTWGPSGADRTQVGPMLAPWTLLSGLIKTRPAMYNQRLHYCAGRPYLLIGCWRLWNEILASTNFDWRIFSALRLWTRGPFISNNIHYKVCDEITYPFLNFNGCTVEV